MSNQTLLEKAKQVQINKKSKIKCSSETIELAMAWLKDEVSRTQMNEVLGKSKTNGNLLYSVAIWLKQAYRENKIIIK